MIWLTRIPVWIWFLLVVLLWCVSAPAWLWAPVLALGSFLLGGEVGPPPYRKKSEDIAAVDQAIDRAEQAAESADAAVAHHSTTIREEDAQIQADAQAARDEVGQAAAAQRMPGIREPNWEPPS
ncbi:MAG: hypothetical protein ACE366_16425 [Bradymonadia bacterium]